MYNINQNKFYNNLSLLEQSLNSDNPIEYLSRYGLNYLKLMEISSVEVDIDLFIKYQQLVKDIFTNPSKVVESSQAISNNSNKVIESDQTVDESFEGRNQSEFIREGETISVDGKSINKITSYKFKVFVKNKPTFEGELSRTEMELIHRLYSSEGANIQVKSLAREFPQYTQNQIKKILRTFSITKACSPLAPHQIEEMSLTEAVEFSVRIKENLINKKVEEERIRYNENKVKELTKELSNLKNKQNQLKELISEINYPESPILFKYKLGTSNKLIISLSDIHVGASVSKDSIYENEWNENELELRLNLVVESLLKHSDNLDEIVVFNLGDSLDGYKGETTRGGHQLPQNMNDKEQVRVFVRQMLRFFDNLYENFRLPMSYYCVGESNHDGDMGWLANHKLISMLEIKYPDMDTEVFDKFIDYVNINDTTFVLSHGKDNKDMFKNLPLTLDVNTENKINEYLDYHGLSGNIVFVKGDLHQSAITHGKRFTYWSVGSIFGSSEWIHKNMGNSKAFCDYAILYDDNSLITSRIKLN